MKIKTPVKKGEDRSASNVSSRDFFKHLPSSTK